MFVLICIFIVITECWEDGGSTVQSQTCRSSSRRRVLKLKLLASGLLCGERQKDIPPQNLLKSWKSGCFIAWMSEWNSFTWTGSNCCFTLLSSNHKEAAWEVLLILQEKVRQVWLFTYLKLEAVMKMLEADWLTQVCYYSQWILGPLMELVI